VYSELKINKLISGTVDKIITIPSDKIIEFHSIEIFSEHSTKGCRISILDDVNGDMSCLDEIGLYLNNATKTSELVDKYLQGNGKRRVILRCEQLSGGAYEVDASLKYKFK
jgi:hypothetical protein